jgi:hypothetical protein
MADGFIVRKGGAVTEQALAPTITEVSTTETEIVFTITNNDASSAVILWEVGDTTPDANSIELAAAATSSNITVTGLTIGVYSVYATANVTGKVKSNVTQEDIEIAFTPSSLSPQLWLDASDSSTITESSGSVSQWNNKGSLGNFTQGTGASQPTTGVTTLNGLNVLDFADDFLIAANQNEWKFLHDGTVHEFFSVIRVGNTADPDTFLNIIGNEGGSGTKTGFNLTYDDRSSISVNDLIRHRVTKGSTPRPLQNDSANDYFTPNQFVIISAFTDPSNATAANRGEVRINGASLLNNNTNTAAVSTGNPTHALEICGDGAARNSANSVAEMIVISGANATSTNRTAIIDYLSNKWGISI